MRRSNMAKVIEVVYRRNQIIRPEDELQGFRFFTKEGSENPADDVAGFKMFNLRTRNVSEIGWKFTVHQNIPQNMA